MVQPLNIKLYDIILGNAIKFSNICQVLWISMH